MPAKVKELTRTDIQTEFKKLRREVVTGDSTYMARYLDRLAALAANARRTKGVFKRWSHRNQMMLTAQERKLAEHHVGLYAGHAQWAKMDRAVRDDARAKFIYRPVGGRPAGNDNHDGDAVAAEAPADHGEFVTTDDETPRQQHVARFALQSVYDWTDTYSLDPTFIEPDWAAPLAAGDQATLDTLVASSPVPVHFDGMAARREHGYLGDDGIHIDASMPVGNQIFTLAHELTHHHLGHLELIRSAPAARREQVRASCEQEAALGQWLVCRAFGFDDSVDEELTENVAAYLRSWLDADGNEVEGHKARLRMLNDRLDTAMGAMNTILDQYVNVDTLVDA